MGSVVLVYTLKDGSNFKGHDPSGKFLGDVMSGQYSHLIKGAAGHLFTIQPLISPPPMDNSDKTTDKSSSSSSSTNSPHLAFTAISNVKLHVPIQLSFSQPNYKKWCRLFLLLVRRFNLHGFLSGSRTPSSAADDEWFQLDALLQGWILSTVTDEVSDLVISSTSTASELWQVIHDLFHDNKPARAMQLEHQFRTTVKGSMPMATYCQTLRNIADWLDDVDAPVSESQLVLQLLRGLPDDLQAQTSWMQFQQPQPNFLQVRSALLLLERQRLHSIETGTALLAGQTSGQPATNRQQPHGRTGVADPAAGRGYPGRGGGRGRGRGRNSSGQRHSDGYGSWNSPSQNPNPTPGGETCLCRPYVSPLVGLRDNEFVAGLILMVESSKQRS
ncbi:hypothetical protein DM860_013355 [Cuscuta australis]|uniref:Retrotransposon Copia-like N-terminal domain-containing protein n=1 Tax=Cuscuta australis TaxID=267555 RepID=A0A328DQ51_9ASTE|nr:hypothetical protein DM860_013355 [Cuscuta australis]